MAEQETADFSTPHPPRQAPDTENDTEHDPMDKDNPFASNASDNAPVWAKYGAQAKNSDDQISQVCNSALDSLLIFATLFSAILSAFLIEIRKGLQEDLQSTTNFLLSTVIELQRNSSAVTPDPKPFVPTLTSRWLNGLWFSSLTFSLITALGASLAKGWIAQYNLPSSWTTAGDACDRHHRFIGIKGWYLQSIILGLPIFMHIAFFQFFAGLVVLLREDDSIIGTIILILVVVATSLYVAITLLPTIFPDCPFQTPISRIIIAIKSSNETDKASDAEKAAALGWLLQSSRDEKDVKLTVQALAGLPATVDVERSLHERRVISILSHETSKSLRLRGHLPSKNKEYLKACLYAIIRLLQTRTPDSDAKDIFQPLKSLLDPPNPFPWNELGRGVCEVALCAVLRLKLLHRVDIAQETVFFMDLPVLQKACPQKYLKTMLTEVVVLHRSVRTLLPNLRDDPPGTRARAWLTLQEATLSELKVDESSKSSRFTRWKRSLKSRDENEQVRCIMNVEGLLGDETFRKEIVLPGDQSPLHMMLSLGKDAVSLVVLATMGALLKHDDIRGKLVDTVSIKTIVTLIKDSKLGSDMRQAAIDGIRTLAGYGDIGAKIVKRTVLIDILALMKHSDWNVRIAAIEVIGRLANHKNIRVEIVELHALTEVIVMVKDFDLDVRAAAIEAILKFASYDDTSKLIAIVKIHAVMKESDPGTRTAAIRAILSLASTYNIGTAIVKSGILNEIISMLNDPGSDVHTASLEAILSLASNNAIRAVIARSNVLSIILSMLKASDSDVRTAAIEAIRSLTGYHNIRAAIIQSKAPNEIISMLTDPALKVCTAAIEAICRLIRYRDTKDEIVKADAVTKIVPMLECKDLDVRVAAIEAFLKLANHGEITTKVLDSNVLTEIIGMLKDTHWDVRLDAIKATTRLASHDEIRAKIIDSDALEKIVASLKDSDYDVRAASINSVVSLAEYDDVKTKFVELTAFAKTIALLTDPNLTVRVASAEAVVSLAKDDQIRAQIFDSEATSEIVALLNGEAEDLRKVAIDLVLTLSAYSDTRPKIINSSAIAEIVRSLKDEKDSVREAAIRAISTLTKYENIKAKFVKSAALATLARLISDDPEYMQDDIYSAISKLADDSSNFRPITDLLGHERSSVVLSGLGLVSVLMEYRPLRTMLISDCLTRLVDILNHDSNEVSRQCFEVVSCLWEYSDINDILEGSDVIFVFLKWLNSEDERKKPSAERLLSKIGLYDPNTPKKQGVPALQPSPSRLKVLIRFLKRSERPAGSVVENQE